jgi:hypothetical protein
MSADTDPRKSPCANTGPDSLQNLPHTVSNNPALSIQPVNLAQVRDWLCEAIRIAREAASTGRSSHMLALVRHLDGFACRVGSQREELK